MTGFYSFLSGRNVVPGSKQHTAHRHDQQVNMGAHDDSPLLATNRGLCCVSRLAARVSASLSTLFLAGVHKHIQGCTGWNLGGVRFWFLVVSAAAYLTVDQFSQSPTRLAQLLQLTLRRRGYVDWCVELSDRPPPSSERHIFTFCNRAGSSRSGLSNGGELSTE